MTVVLAGGVFFLGGKYIDAKKEIARIESQGKVITEVQKNTIYAIEAMQTGGKAFSREMAKQEFDNLEINGEQVTQDELREW
ncbi:hypothetical protein [Treponema phagedenis]|nr:hypothetical protein [Treponema phagedenis]QEJ96781.1 hypothetical protein FUT82_01435 [Treponema phagedenis]